MAGFQRREAGSVGGRGAAEAVAARLRKGDLLVLTSGGWGWPLLVEVGGFVWWAWEAVRKWDGTDARMTPALLGTVSGLMSGVERLRPGLSF